MCLLLDIIGRGAYKTLQDIYWQIVGNPFHEHALGPFWGGRAGLSAEELGVGGHVWPRRSKHHSPAYCVQYSPNT